MANTSRNWLKKLKPRWKLSCPSCTTVAPLTTSTLGTPASAVRIRCTRTPWDTPGSAEIWMASILPGWASSFSATGSVKKTNDAPAGLSADPNLPMPASV